VSSEAEGAVDADADAADVHILDSTEAGGKAIRGAGFRIVGYVLGLLLGLVSVPFMIRHLGAVDYGYYITVSSIVFIIAGLAEAGLTNLGIREFSVLAGDERNHFLRNLVGLRFALTTIGVLVAAAITWVTGADTQIVTGVLIAGLGLLVSLTQQTYMIPLTADLRLGSVTALELLKQTTLSALFIGLVIAGAQLPAFFWASVVAGGVMFIATVFLMRGHGSLRPAGHWPTWWRVLRQTLPYAAAAAVGIVYFRIAVILMSYVSTAEETGIFSAAFRIVEVCATLPWVLVVSVFPILARAAGDDDDERLSYALQRVFEVSLIIGALLAIGLGVSAPFAIKVVAGPGFEQSVEVLRLLALALVTSFLVATWSFALLSLKRFSDILWSNLVAAVVAIIGTLVLAPSHGANGAALATVIAEASLVLTAVFFLRRARPALSPNLRIVWKVVLASALAIGVALAVPAPALVLSALAGLVYAAAVLALRAVPPELFRALLRRDG